MPSDTPLSFLLHVATSHLPSSVRPFRVSDVLVQLDEHALAVTLSQRDLDRSQLSSGQLIDVARGLAADAALDFLHILHGGSSQEHHNFTAAAAYDPSCIVNKGEPSRVFEHSRVWLIKESKPE
ncbi:MAG: hypothetical protein JWL59_1384 [Chthoniobacteraceae bacterium]|nr:hypothetical protein [Chthoniobacteraceae bacterium]